MLALLSLLGAAVAGAPTVFFNVSVDQASSIFDFQLGATTKTVATFVGFSAAGYESMDQFAAIVNVTLSKLNPVRSTPAPRCVVG